MREEETIREVLTDARTIAVVGLSSKLGRPSHGVAAYLQAQGYRIVPVNPSYAGTEILGERCYANLTDAAAALADEGTSIDIVDCFRKSECVGAAMDEAIAVGARCVWTQLDVIDHAAAARAEQAGLQVVMDKCIEIEHLRLH